mgnify:CR=1 FL=1
MLLHAGGAHRRAAFLIAHLQIEISGEHIVLKHLHGVRGQKLWRLRRPCDKRNCSRGL